MKRAAIYYLHLNGTVFYVGQTTNPHNRLCAHRKNFGEKTEMIIIDWCAYELRLKRETYFMKYYKSMGFNLLNSVHVFSKDESDRLVSIKISEDVHSELKIFAVQNKMKNLTSFIDEAVKDRIKKLKK